MARGRSWGRRNWVEDRAASGLGSDSASKIPLTPPGNWFWSQSKDPEKPLAGPMVRVCEKNSP